ncbi:MAG: thioesterase [Nocardioidaceae bacterium]|nr:thioesterase [Nocardioidaceae bacterium]
MPGRASPATPTATGSPSRARGCSRSRWSTSATGRRAEVEAERQFVVGDDDTAAAVGSGSLPVLGTPRLLAWCEAVTCDALEPALPNGSTSVGTEVTVQHRAPSQVGATVTVTATREAEDGRLHTFTVEAHHDDGTLVGSARITRAVVDAERFLARLHR